MQFGRRVSSASCRVSRVWCQWHIMPMPGLLQLSFLPHRYASLATARRQYVRRFRALIAFQWLCILSMGVWFPCHLAREQATSTSAYALFSESGSRSDIDGAHRPCLLLAATVLNIWPCSYPGVSAAFASHPNRRSQDDTHGIATVLLLLTAWIRRATKAT